MTRPCPLCARPISRPGPCLTCRVAGQLADWWEMRWTVVVLAVLWVAWVLVAAVR